MSNLLLTEETFTAKMSEKKAMLDNISSQLGGIMSPYTYMTVDEYLDATIDPNKVYWVLADDGRHGVYKNGNLCDGEKVIPTWADIQEWVRAGTFASHYSVGDQFSVKYDGNKTAWDIVAIDVATPADTSKTHSVTLMPHDLLPDYMMFDNAEPNNSDSDRQRWGNNRYLYSNIRVWLNSSAVVGSWWTSQHTYDAAPDYATTKAGFMSYFESDFLNVIGKTKIRVVKAYVDGGGYEDLSNEYFYLPSTAEVGLGNVYAIAEGALFPYFDSDTKRTKSKNGDSTYPWHLRTYYYDSSDSVYVVGRSGTLDIYSANSVLGVVPACNII